MTNAAPEFESFREIKTLSKILMTITQKIHGTNAQVYVFKTEAGELDLRAGSRTRWIYPGDDNYGFAAFVEANKAAFLALGEGRHYGEWAGPGINTGEGLTQKVFVLFSDPARYEGKTLPPQTVFVPALYRGPVDLAEIEKALEVLRTEGSKLVPGYMHPEGVVVLINGTMYKKVFKSEETQWDGAPKVKAPKDDKPRVDYSYLMQPIRLEKLLSRDERYLRDFPKTLGDICKDYFADLIKENQIPGDEDQVRATRKGATGDVFKFVKTIVEEKING